MTKPRPSRTRRRPTKGDDVVGPVIAAVGGRYRPLSCADVARMREGVFEILAQIGLSDAPDNVLDILRAVGCATTDDGRVVFPRPVVEQAITACVGPLLLAGQVQTHDLILGGDHSYTGSGGASPMVVDLETEEYRPSYLKDLCDFARLCDALPYCQFFARSVVARDMPDDRSLDLNTAFGCLTHTQKHVITSASAPEHVEGIAQIAYQIAGGEAVFRARPILSLNINHVVPPLRFHEESAQVIVAAVRAGIPVHCNVFGQLGASSPVTLAGSVAQTIAEGLAGLVLAYAVDPAAKVICGPRPMITDLRTGGMSGGSGEQTLATAMASQIMRDFGLVHSVIAGATDSKAADAQSGFEKSLSVTLAVHSGAHLVTQALGTQAGLMAANAVAYVLDNDMAGSILRSATQAEVSTETLAFESIKDVIAGEGHFLGQPETYARMKTDFLYPDVSDRTAHDQWSAAGGPRIETAAKARAEEILATHHPDHVPAYVFDALITKFDLAFSKKGNP